MFERKVSQYEECVDRIVQLHANLHEPIIVSPFFYLDSSIGRVHGSRNRVFLREFEVVARLDAALVQFSLFRAFRKIGGISAIP